MTIKVLARPDSLRFLKSLIYVKELEYEHIHIRTHTHARPDWAVREKMPKLFAKLAN